jgi:hypothetical protein
MMDLLKIDGTSITPSIEFNAETGVLNMKGRSIPENSLDFYQPIYKWLDEYTENPAKKTIMNVQLDYFNTSSSKCILDILKKIDKIDELDNDVIIKWYYNESDEDMMESGEDYMDLINAPFELIEIE